MGRRKTSGVTVAKGDTARGGLDRCKKKRRESNSITEAVWGEKMGKKVETVRLPGRYRRRVTRGFHEGQKEKAIFAAQQENLKGETNKGRVVGEKRRQAQVKRLKKNGGGGKEILAKQRVHPFHSRWTDTST